MATGQAGRTQVPPGLATDPPPSTLGASMSTRMFKSVCTLGLIVATGATLGQTSHIKPPKSQAWIDIATFSGLGMPMGGMGGMGGGGGSAMSVLGGLLGGGAGRDDNRFGNTQTASSGRWVDVTLSSRLNPGLSDGQQAVPPGFMAPALKLKVAPAAKPAPSDDDRIVDREDEPPKGRLLLYWGCGAKVRAGQPKVLDMASASMADFKNFFVSRSATRRGAHTAVGRPVWPQEQDRRMLPAGASLVGEHQFSGSGVPDNFRFQIPAAQDLMPPLQVRQTAQGGSTELSWAALPTARAYFASGMGAGAKEEMILWTSSELPDAGFGLTDYQTNLAVDGWLRERVLLPPATTRCAVPAGVFPDGNAMLRLIAYGNELNLVHPPRPADPKAPWEPEWAVKLRVKSMASLMLGMEGLDADDKDDAADKKSAKPSDRASDRPADRPADDGEKRPKALDILKGILGR